jgi:membrane fusion protein, heavy metal efflux system
MTEPSEPIAPDDSLPELPPSRRPKRWRGSPTTRGGQSSVKLWPRAIAAVLVLTLGVWALAKLGGGKAPVAVAAADSAATTGTAATGGDSVLRLDSTAQRLAGVRLLTIAPSTTGTLTANGTIGYDADRVSVVSSRAEARVISVRADLGQQVPASGVLATLESPDVGQTRGDLERARANVDVARRNYEREKRLFAESISPEKEMLDAEGAYRTAQADFNAASSKLRAVGATGGQGATFNLATPVSGTVVERNASPGQVVGPTTNLFTVADLSRVWITVDVYEGDLSRIRQGATATVVANALPNRTFSGNVTYAGGIVDSASHTFKVRVVVDNAERALRPGMFAQVSIETPVVKAPSAQMSASDAASAGTSASTRSVAPTIVVPETAVQEVNGKQVVFVAGRTPGEFVARPVVLGPRAGNGMIVITSGLSAGDKIAVQGAFQLKSELTKASFGEGE